jgi:hypothetical protein
MLVLFSFVDDPQHYRGGKGYGNEVASTDAA